jgi:hypothetical protein
VVAPTRAAQTAPRPAARRHPTAPARGRSRGGHQDAARRRRGHRWQLGPVDKHGSPRLRFWCVEAAWRLLQFQPNYRGVIWARDKLRDANQSRAKQISVALARRFFVDWWRVRTGRITAAELGFTFPAAT